MSASNARQYATDQIMQALVNGLLAENFFQRAAIERPSEQNLPANEPPEYALLAADASHRLWRWCHDPAGGESLVMVVRPGIAQAWEKLTNSRVLCHRPAAPARERWMALTPKALMRKVFAGLSGQGEDRLRQGEKLFLDALSVSEWQTAQSVDHRVDTRGLMDKSPARFFAIMEQWASLVDRPYHPTAKAKQGLNEQEYRAYMAEFAQPVGLRWVAICKARMICGDGVNAGNPGPADWVADEATRDALRTELQQRGLADTHLAIPVHPWQHRHALPKWLSEDLEAGHCVSLATISDTWLPTSSLRSMAPMNGSAHYLKLPMAVYSLGASRYLPAVKMRNGDLSAKLLHEARARDPRLAETLHLCDESKWWAYMPPEATLFDEPPRHLSAMVRSYPRSLLENSAYRLIPMAALGTPLPEGSRHFFDDGLAQRGEIANEATVTSLFAELCQCFFEVSLRMFRLGMLAEVHGQNAVLVWKEGHCDGLLLRDHDSLRIAVGRLERHGMRDPCYRIKPGHSNTLYHDSLEALLFWLQTLGIQVNLRAIVDTLAGHYGIEPAALWTVMAKSIDAQIERIPFDDDDRALLRRQLFEAPTWPYKHVIAPIIERAGGPGSMPFGSGETTNPFRRLNRNERLCEPRRVLGH